METSLKKKIKKYNGFFFPFCIVSLVIIIMLFGILPAVQKTRDIFEQGKLVQTEVNELNDKVTVLDSIDEAVLESKLQIATSAIPVDQSLATVLQTVETIGAGVGASIHTITVDSSENISTAAAHARSEQERKLGANILPFTINAHITFDQMKEFLMKTSTVRRFIRAKAFNLSSDTEEGLTTSVSFDAFYLPLQSQNSNTPLAPLTQGDESLLSKISAYEHAGQLIVLPDDGSIGTGSAMNPFTF